MTQDFPVPRARRVGWLRELPIRIVKGTRRREQLYDLLYSLSWGETTTNNYGFAPAESDGPERSQLQLYGELLRLLNDSPVESGISALRRSAAAAAAASITSHAGCHPAHS
jgi:hypothetical protein